MMFCLKEKEDYPIAEEGNAPLEQFDKIQL